MSERKSEMTEQREREGGESLSERKSEMTEQRERERGW